MQAYVGYSWGSNRKREELCAVATGNWGCGVYKGNAQLKSLLQVMAVAEIGRDLAYFTFGDEQLRDTIASMHQFLVQNEVTIGKYSTASYSAFVKKLHFKLILRMVP